MITCYDYWSARIIADTPIDSILVGDSLGMVMHGHDTTLPVDCDLIALHTQAVVKGAPNKFIIADMPFLSFRKSLQDSMQNIETLMRAGAHAVKIEGMKGNWDLVQHATESGVPVIVHLGMTPQSIHQMGGFKLQSTTEEAAKDLIQDGLAAQKAGAFCLVAECIPHPLAKDLAQKLQVPVIGIGAGAAIDGQVLVLQDLLGMNPKFRPKFLRTYLNGYEQLKQALEQYHEDVMSENFPSLEEAYT